MKAFCCECGRPVPIVRYKDNSSEWREAPGRCKYHPSAKRFSPTFAAKFFAEYRKEHGLSSPALPSATRSTEMPPGGLGVMWASAAARLVVGGAA